MIQGVLYRSALALIPILVGTASWYIFQFNVCFAFLIALVVLIVGALFLHWAGRLT